MSRGGAPALLAISLTALGLGVSTDALGEQEHGGTTPAISKTDAAAIVNEGNRLFGEKRYAEALARYEEAYARYPSPEIHFNLARAHHGLGDLVLASELYERFLRETKKGAEHRTVREAKRSLETLAAQVGRLAIVSDLTDVSISVDGLRKGDLPMPPQRVAPGPHEIVGEKEGYDPTRTIVEVAPGATKEVVLVMTRREDRPGKHVPPGASVLPDASDAESADWVWPVVGALALVAAVAVALAAASGGGSGDGGELGIFSTREWQRF